MIKGDLIFGSGSVFGAFVSICLLVSEPANDYNPSQ